MIRPKRLPDVTANKTAVIANLELQVKSQTTIVAQAEAKYNSYQSKLAEFNSLLSEAEADLSTAQANHNQYMTVEGNTLGTNQAAETSSEVSQTTYALSKKLLEEWNQVGYLALKSATQIAEVTDYIQKRKAANPLISNDLVNDAVTANKNAATTVKLVINALNDAMDAMTSASEASRSTDLTMLYSEMGVNLTTGNTATGTDVSTALKTLIANALTAAQDNVTAYQNAVNTVTAQTSQAKQEYDEANDQLEAYQSALAAAQVAVAG